MNKTERQYIGKDIWKNNKGRGTFEYVPRFGKTNSAIIIINKFIRSNPTLDIIIIVDSEAIKTQWINELDNNLENPDKVDIFTSHQILNMTDILHYPLVIIDEIHKFTTDRKYNIINGNLIKYKFILGLTGTYPKDTINKQKLDKFAPVIDKIEEEEAIENKWITDSLEFNIAIQFSNSEKKRYFNYSKHIKKVIEKFNNVHKEITDKYGYPIFNNDYDAIMSCYRGKVINGIYRKNSIIRQLIADKKGWKPNLILNSNFNRMLETHWNPDVINNDVKIFYDFVDKRNDLMFNNYIKNRIAFELYKYFKKPTIIFSESIIAAEKIADMINEYDNVAACYHSKIKSEPLKDKKGNYFRYGKYAKKAGEVKMFGKKKIKEHLINDIKNGNIKVLSTVKSLDEGINIPNLEVAISTGGSTNPTQYIQRTYRVKTINKNKDVSLIFNIYFDNFTFENTNQTSRDATKLNIRQAGNENLIFKINYDEEGRYLDYIKEIKNNYI